MLHTEVIIAGCGYVGKKLAQQLYASNVNVTALVKTTESKQALPPHYNALQYDCDEANVVTNINYKDKTVFYFIPPPSQGTTDPRIQNFLNSIPVKQSPEKIVLISTTGVYGNCGNDWVDESRPPAPDTDRAHRRLAAEQYLAYWCDKQSVSYSILRVPGIYGADKLPLQRLKQARPILKLDESPWSNRIHVDDLVQACVKAMAYKGKFLIFNISDGHPSTMSDYFIQVAKVMKLPEPEQISLEACKNIFSENMMSYLIESKKICIERMLKELKVTLKYPTLKDGLSSIASADK